MQKLTFFVICSFLFLAGCKEPPKIDTCVISFKTLKTSLSTATDAAAIAAILNTTIVAKCTPVDEKKQKYALTLFQLDRYSALSDVDEPILLNWIADCN